MKKTILRYILSFLCVAAILCSCGSGKSEIPASPTPGETAVQNTQETDPSGHDNIQNTQTGDNSGKTTADINATVNPDALPVTIDLNDEHQTFDGFGAAYTWYGERLLNSKDPEGGLDALFTDAKLTVLRFKNEYSYYVEGKAPNVTAMAQNYKEARDRAAVYGERVYVLMCCWSPPAYLKSDNSISTGSGTLIKNDDGSYAYDEYAKWWTDSLKYYMSKGIVVDYVSIQNEVDFAPENYEGCLFGPKETNNKASYAKAFLAVYHALKAEFGDNAPLMLGPESMSCVPSTLLSYTNDILKEEPEALAGVAYHLYIGGTGDSDTNTVRPSSFFTNFSGIKKYFGDIRRWQTEFYIGHGIQTAELINNALTVADMTAYLYWSGVWDDSTPGVFESFDLIEVNNAGNWRPTANYYVLRHYSQFIRPGYVRVGTAVKDGAVKAAAFVSPYRNKMAVVLVNTSDKERTVRLDAEGYTITGTQMYLSVFGDECKSAEGLFAEAGSLDNYSGITIPAKSVLSIDIDGYAGDTPPVVPEITPIVYENDVIINEPEQEVPAEDTILLDKHFEDAGDLRSFFGMGTAQFKIISDTGMDGSSCVKITGRTDAWHGIAISEDLFDHYGYMLRVSFDCMLEKGGTISCTQSFTCNSEVFYPDGENNRIICENMEPGEWRHAEGYMTIYQDIEKGSYFFYWEVPGSTDDFCLDNVKIEELYTMPVGSFMEQNGGSL